MEEMPFPDGSMDVVVGTLLLLGFKLNISYQYNI